MKAKRIVSVECIADLLPQLGTSITLTAFYFKLCVFLCDGPAGAVMITSGHRPSKLSVVLSLLLLGREGRIVCYWSYYLIVFLFSVDFHDDDDDAALSLLFLKRERSYAPFDCGWIGCWIIEFFNCFDDCHCYFLVVIVIFWQGWSLGACDSKMRHIVEFNWRC